MFTLVIMLPLNVYYAAINLPCNYADVMLLCIHKVYKVYYAIIMQLLITLKVYYSVIIRIAI